MIDDAFTKEVTLLADEMASPKQRSRMLADFAREQIEVVKIEAETEIGRRIRPPKVTVDGKAGAPLAGVRPDGTVIAEFNTETSAVRWILRELELVSPVLEGVYKRSHILFADGRQIDPDAPLPDAAEFVILNSQPYARRIERGSSDQAKEGVYEAVAAVAGTRFKGEADITFGFQAFGAEGDAMARRARRKRGSRTRARDDRQPAIFVRML